MAADYYEGDTFPNTTNAHDRGTDASLSVILHRKGFITMNGCQILQPVSRPATSQVLSHPERRHIWCKARELQARLDNHQRAS